MADPTRRRALATLGAALAWGAAPAVTGRALDHPAGRPLTRAHAHNDYEHPRPLFDALDYRFGSIEADIHLVDGALLVGHDAADLHPARTLESLYLDPLHALVRTNHGSVYEGWKVPVQLLIDVKTDGAATYRELDRHLQRHQQILTTYAHGKVHPGPVTAVVSGDRGTRAPMAAQQVRHAFYDGNLTDLGTSASASLIPLISENWTATFTWRGNGPIPAAERAKLRKIVSTAHAHRQRVRFWATPDDAGLDRDALWNELCDAGTDLLNTDDLAGLGTFLTARGLR
jgi:hypothetical protein